MTAPALLVPADTGAADWTERKRRDADAAAAALPTARVRRFAGDRDIHAQHRGELADALAMVAAEGSFA